MKKGCIAGLVVGILLLVAVGLVAMKVFAYGESSFLFGIEEAGKNYMAENPGKIPASNEQWVTALQGTDYDNNLEANGRKTAIEIDSLIKNGKFMNPTGSQEISMSVEDGKLKAVLAGKDGQIGTADDITSDKIRALIKE